jgi:hypothetical protein
MSVKVMTWVWERSPVAGNERLVLLAIADSAEDDGRNAWPSVATLARKTRLDPRTVQRVIRRLQDSGHLAVATAAGRGGANVYSVLMNPTGAATADAVDNAGDGAADPRQTATPGNLPPPAPVPPSPRHQCQGTPGTAVPPERPYVRTSTSSRAPATAKAAEPTPRSGGGGAAGSTSNPVSEVLDSLGGAWRLTRGQRRRLVPAVRVVLAAGWSPESLAAELGANPDGVRAPYAVLRSRLADLAESRAPVSSRPARPPHCGVCVERTRQRETSDGRPYPCPVCHSDPARRSRGAEIEAAESAVDAQTGTAEGHPLRLPSLDGAA